MTQKEYEAFSEEWDKLLAAFTESQYPHLSPFFGDDCCAHLPYAATANPENYRRTAFELLKRKHRVSYEPSEVRRTWRHCSICGSDVYHNNVPIHYVGYSCKNKN